MKTSHGHETFLGGELANSLYESIQEKSREQASLLVESRLTEFIKNGEPRKIAEYVLLFEDENTNLLQKKRGTLQDAKLTFISAASITRHISVDAGLNLQLASAIYEAYIERLTSYKNPDEIYIFIFQMMMDYASRIAKLKSVSSTHPLILKMMNIISTYLYSPLSLADIADHMGYSKEYLCRLFRSETGKTLHSYIIANKITEAQNMLRYTNYCIAEISENLGFSSVSHFHRSFRSLTGITPHAYRLLSSDKCSKYTPNI